MEIKDIKEAKKKVDNLEEIREQIKQLDKSKNIDSVSVRYYQSGTGNWNYDVSIREDDEFLQTIKTLIKDYLIRNERKLSKEIELI